MMISNAPVANIISVMIALPYLVNAPATATQNCVPTAMSKSVLTAVVETVKVALNGRLVGYAKKKPVDIVLNMTA